VNPVFTIGYTGWHPPDLAAAVTSRGAVLVDVRFRPFSRSPAWLQGALVDLVGEENYVECREFGNVNYNTGGPIHIADAKAGLAKVAPILQERPIVLLCACSQVATCHRTKVAEFLNGRLGAPVEHLMPRVYTPKTEVERPNIMGITLQQPWAWAIHEMGKPIENRGWAPPEWMLGRYLAIHAGKKWDAEGAEWIHSRFFRYPLREEMTFGAIVAVAQLVDVVRESPSKWFVGPVGWVLDDVVAIEPVPCRGKQRLWALSREVYQQVRANWAKARKEQAA
jgi:rhodanese-related sulfurtransferase